LPVLDLRGQETRHIVNAVGVLEEGQMAGWYGARGLNRSAKVAIAAVILALALVAVVPLAFIVAIFLMLFGHIVGGLALIGGSILAAGAAVGLAALAGIRQVRHVREVLTGRDFQDFRVMRLSHDDYDYLG
jgi:uncharacterized membrane protein YdjX (TVP38/TMEM64 family)